MKTYCPKQKKRTKKKFIKCKECPKSTKERCHTFDRGMKMFQRQSIKQTDGRYLSAVGRRWDDQTERVVEWSWWSVTSPLWIWFVLAVLFTVVCLQGDEQLS